MKKYIQIALILFFSGLSAQEKTVLSVFFEFDKFTLDNTQKKSIIKFLNSPEFSKFEAIQLFGYCDDRGTEDYNNILSKNRVTTVQNILMSMGVSQNKIFICEGLGRVSLDKDTVKNIEKTRYRNRRVDLVFVTKTTFNYFPANPKVGNLIVLDRITFEMGSSLLTLRARKELDRIAVLLLNHKTLQFEIRGHVCCTTLKHSDAIDQETQDRNLSINRAKNVFIYLRSKGISPYRMSFKGYGNLFPLGREDALDRRVEFFITKQ